MATGVMNREQTAVRVCALCRGGSLHGRCTACRDGGEDGGDRSPWTAYRGSGRYRSRPRAFYAQLTAAVRAA